MSEVLQQNEFENGKQNGTNDLLDNQSIILEFELFDKKIEMELNLGHVSFSGVPENWLLTCLFIQSKFTAFYTMLLCDWSKVWKASAPVIPKNLHGLGICIEWSRFHCVFWHFAANNGNPRKLSIILYGLV